MSTFVEQPYYHPSKKVRSSVGLDVLGQYTETKKFSNILQIRIFITKIHVEITQTE